MRKFLSVFSKLLAVAVAFLILNIICFFYYNMPVRQQSETGSTDYKWEENKVYSLATEGFAFGVTDSNGFNNLETFAPGEIDVLVMGSSHAEAFNVAQDKSFTSLLNKKSDADGSNMNVYNIGVSAHTFPRCLNNLPAAVDEFKPTKYLIIETSSLADNSAAMNAILSDEIKPIATYNNGILEKLQKFPFLRRLYAQIKSVAAAKSPGSNTIEETQPDYQPLDKVLKNCVAKCDENNIKIIILYNCTLTVDHNGNIEDLKNTDEIEIFKGICEKNGAIFVNMYEPFKENYYKTFNLPHGFSNTEVGTGHLNEEGHRVIADEIYKLISR